MSASAHSWRQRVSRSSILSTMRPPWLLTESQATRHEKTFPRCMRPEGEGAKRPTTGRAACAPLSLICDRSFFMALSIPRLTVQLFVAAASCGDSRPCAAWAIPRMRAEHRHSRRDTPLPPALFRQWRHGAFALVSDPFGMRSPNLSCAMARPKTGLPATALAATGSPAEKGDRLSARGICWDPRPRALLLCPRAIGSTSRPRNATISLHMCSLHEARPHLFGRCLAGTSGPTCMRPARAHASAATMERPLLLENGMKDAP